MTKDSAAQPLPTEPSSSSPAAGAAPAVPKKPLTAKQQAVWDLTRPVSEGGQGKTRAQAAAILGISAPVASKYLQACYRKMGLKRVAGQMQLTEVKKPEVAAAALEAAADPMAESQRAAIDRVNEQLKASGVPDKVSQALVRRLKSKYANAVFAARELRTGEILKMLGEKIDLAAFYLDDKVLAEASARDIMLGLGVMIEKRNLLRGEPTSIVSDHERKKLHELWPALLEEGRRRGITVDGQVTEKTLEPSRT
ncbi:MAG TPA: hypothetical protein VGQ19_18335 [Burkholderiales bacterium]|nr:hypothetical protein [Burkholderiales bacterium]